MYHSTPVKWRRKYRHEARRSRYCNNNLSIFSWLADHTVAGSDWIAEVGVPVCFQKSVW